LRDNRPFAAVAILTLTLGIGVSTALFSVIDAALLRPLPYDHPEQLVTASVEQKKTDGEPSRLIVGEVSEDFLETYGITPIVGRAITADDTREGTPKVALLGHAFWMQERGGDRGVLGRTIKIQNGTYYATRLIAAFLFQVKPHDATTLACVVAILATAAALAAWLPARRAASVDPVIALRAE
jgi:ABC-type antimicrobial peptide transport system permease subunit